MDKEQPRRRDMYAFCLGTLEGAVKGYLNGYYDRDYLRSTLKDIEEMLSPKEDKDGERD